MLSDWKLITRITSCAESRMSAAVATVLARGNHVSPLLNQQMDSSGGNVTTASKQAPGVD
jgi:hypothetical protein